MTERPATAPTVPARPGAGGGAGDPGGHLDDAPGAPGDASLGALEPDSLGSQPGAPSITPEQLGVAVTLPEDAVARARPALPSLELDVAQARAEAALFGTAEAVKIGRYRVIERAGAGGMGVVWSAWDPELGRGVALKLASSGDAVARQRARDEGRALARLSHPNVVPIYDVLEHDDGVFLVMELVKGKTLRSAAIDQTPIQIVRAYRQAGAGLAAAHEAGLIHRDFKPDNAILGADGRVRVLDFGLAHQVTADEGESPAIAGTPRYMAPEQRAGATLTPAVDQFGLCVALRESLLSAGGVPRWVAPILERGMLDAPGDRYPSMDALLAALALDPATRWRRRIAVGAAVLAVGGAIGGFSLGRAGATEPACGGGPALIAGVWAGARRTEIAASLHELPTAYARDGVPRVLATLDGYRDAWLTLHRGSCLAHRRGELSTALFDRRTACLGRRRASLTAIAERAAATTAPELAGLVEAVDQLPEIAACSDDDALTAGVAPPPVALAPSVAPIDQLLATAAVDRDAGRLEQAEQGADAAVAAAERLGYAPLVARARLARGRVALVGMLADRGAADFAVAIHTALVVGDEPVAIEAFARRVWAAGTNLDRGEQADPRAGLDLIEAIGERLGDRVAFARALLASNLGSVALAVGDRPAALGAFERAHALAATVTGPGALELSVIDEGLLHTVDDPATRVAIGHELIATLTARVGPVHPRTLRARIVVANIADDTEAALTDLRDACAAMIQLHPSVGRTIGECGYEALWNALTEGDHARGAIADAVLAAEPHGAVPPQLALAAAYRLVALGDTPAALVALRRLGNRADDAAWWNRLYAADGLAAAAAVARADGRTAEARADRLAAAAIYDAIADALPPPLLARRRRAIAAR